MAIGSEVFQFVAIVQRLDGFRHGLQFRPFFHVKQYKVRLAPAIIVIFKSGHASGRSVVDSSFQLLVIGLQFAVSIISG